MGAPRLAADVRCEDGLAACPLTGQECTRLSAHTCACLYLDLSARGAQKRRLSHQHPRCGFLRCFQWKEPSLPEESLSPGCRKCPRWAPSAWHRQRGRKCSTHTEGVLEPVRRLPVARAAAVQPLGVVLDSRPESKSNIHTSRRHAETTEKSGQGRLPGRRPTCLLWTPRPPGEAHRPP